MTLKYGIGGLPDGWGKMVPLSTFTDLVRLATHVATHKLLLARFVTQRPEKKPATAGFYEAF
jgi:hypothetical protein